MVSWDAAYRQARTLAHKIIESTYKPDIIIAIARGGLVPGRMICDYLLQDELLSIRTEHWGIASKKQIARIKFSLPTEADIHAKKVLVVDDVADTGDSLLVILEYLKQKHPSKIRTAVLQYKTCSTVIPDYWAEKLNTWNWIVYPWALNEDLAGFVKELLVESLTTEEIRKGLKSNFDISITRKKLFETLIDLQKLGKLKNTEKGNMMLWDKVEP